MSDIEQSFEMRRCGNDSGVLDRLISEGRLHQVITGGGEEKLYPSAGYMFEDLREADLDENCIRELAYELESRGFLGLRRTEAGWVWQPTLAGRRVGLCSHEKPLHVVLVDLGLTEQLQRRLGLGDVRDGPAMEADPAGHAGDPA